MSTRLTRAAAAAMPLSSTRPMRASNLRGFGAMPIRDTGMRGFLKWAQQEYPPAIYQQIANGIQQHIPQAFSGYMLGGWRRFNRLNGLSDSTTPTVDTSDAANSTASSPSWGADISAIIGTATGAYLNIEQQQNQQAIINAQLQAAANGRAPLPISLSSSGITFGTAGITAGSLVLFAVLGFVGLKALKVL
jgi:hypothetical protein